MADNEINYLEKKYCALCFEPLDDNFDGTCGACGQKTTALDVLKRLKLDGSVDKKSRTAPRFAVLLSALGFVLQLAYIIVLLLLSANVASKNDTSAPSPDFLVSLTEEEQKKGEIYSRYFEKAMKFDDYQEFLDDCRPLEYEPDFYSGVWNNAAISKRIHKDQSQLPSDTQTTKKQNNVLPILAISILALFIVVSLCGLALCAAVLFGADGSVRALIMWSGECAKIFAVTLNFFSAALLFLSLYQFSSLNEQLGGGRLRVSRLWKIHRAKNPIGNTDEWCCEYCGYINSRLDSECKSCGKYR